jgi:putative addiction module component (TIGR02574 family)
MATAEELYRDVLALPVEMRVELTERLVASLAGDIPEEVTAAHLAEVKKRIAEIDSGEVELIPGDEVLAGARRLLSEKSNADQ